MIVLPLLFLIIRFRAALGVSAGLALHVAMAAVARLWFVERLFAG